MYCSRANVWQEWGFTELRSGDVRRSSHSAQQLTQKRQSSGERWVPGERYGARFVYSIRDPAFWTNWLCPCQRGKAREKAQEEEGREKTEPLRLGSGPSPAEQPCLCQVPLVWFYCGHAPHTHFFFTISLLSFMFCSVLLDPPHPPYLLKWAKYWLKVEWKAFRSLFPGRGCPVSGHRGY